MQEWGFYLEVLWLWRISGRSFQRGKGEWSSTWSQRNDEVGGTL